MQADGTQNLIHNGRPKGAVGKVRRAFKHALMLAAEKSRHSKSHDLEGYCLFLADEKPELYVSLLARLLPKTTKIYDDADHPGHHNLVFNINTPVSEMVSLFEQRIKGVSAQTIIEHDPEEKPE